MPEFDWASAVDVPEEPPRFSGYPAQDTPVFPTTHGWNPGDPIPKMGYEPIDLPGRADRTPRVILGKSVRDVPGMVEPGTILCSRLFPSRVHGLQRP
jgi:hypothetical protein